MGVPSSKIGLLERGVNTESEALDLIHTFPKIDHLVLVTSAMHLRRAVRLFDLMGIKAIPAPADFGVKVHPAGNKIRWFPSFEALIKWNPLIHEWVGWMWIEVRTMLGLFPSKKDVQPWVGIGNGGDLSVEGRGVSYLRLHNNNPKLTRLCPETDCKVTSLVEGLGQWSTE